MSLSSTSLREFPLLLRGDAASMNAWMEERQGVRFGFYVVIILAGAGLFGAAVGSWRAPYQALFTGIKFPLVILLTSLGNALLNGMLAPLLGLNLSFRRSFLAILMSFTIAAAILGAFSPLVFFLIWNLPALGTPESGSSHGLLLLIQVGIIAFAGIAANVRLLQLLRRLCGSAAITRRVLLAWLAGNLFLGSQLSWMLRPFVGSPGLPIEFLRPDAWKGNFFEAVFHVARHLLTN